MKFDTKIITRRLSPALEYLEKYAVIIFISLFVGIYCFLILKISSYIQAQPSQSSINEKLQTVQRPKIDQEALKRIQDLEDQNVEVKSLFENARKNPFSE